MDNAVELGRNPSASILLEGVASGSIYWIRLDPEALGAFRDEEEVAVGELSQILSFPNENL